MIRKKHYVIVKNINGTPDKQRLKIWLRQNPQELKEYDPDNTTSHQLAYALKSKGWKYEELSDSVLIIKPDEKGNITYADTLREDNLEIDSLEDEQIIEEAEEIAFGLERDMQSALRENIEQLEKGLKIIDGGKERIIDAGRIDITALDVSDNIVIIELKANSASPKSIAQILAYMGSIAESDKKMVRGILIANDFHRNAILASRAVPNLLLKKYSIQFAFGTP